MRNWRGRRVGFEWAIDLDPTWEVISDLSFELGLGRMKCHVKRGGLGILGGGRGGGFAGLVRRGPGGWGRGIHINRRGGEGERKEDGWFLPEHWRRYRRTKQSAQHRISKAQVLPPPWLAGWYYYKQTTADTRARIQLFSLPITKISKYNHYLSERARKAKPLKRGGKEDIHLSWSDRGVRGGMGGDGGSE